MESLSSSRRSHEIAAAAEMAADGVRFEQRHGKSRVRVGRVWREASGRHHFVEWNVSISLLSDCLPAYTAGDNSDIVATDTMKNTVGFIAMCRDRMRLIWIRKSS